MSKPLLFLPCSKPLGPTLTATRRGMPLDVSTLMDTCCSHMLREPDGEPDAELITEEACRWQAVLECVDDLWVLDRSGDDRTAVNVDTLECRPLRQLLQTPHQRLYGNSPADRHTGRATEDGLAQHPDMMREADVDALLVHPEWSAIAERPHVRCGLMDRDAGDEGIDIRDVFAGFAASEIRDVAVKAVASKSFPVLKASLAGDPGSVLVTPTDDVEGLAPIDLISGFYEGKPAVVVSPWAEMRHEYRTFVVGGFPVTGAGCIEEFTPRDRSSTMSPFDVRTRERRGKAAAPEARPAIVETLIGFAHRKAAQIVTLTGLRDFVLDVALSDDGRPVVVEANGMLASGLYASDPHSVVRALIA